MHRAHTNNKMLELCMIYSLLLLAGFEFGVVAQHFLKNSILKLKTPANRRKRGYNWNFNRQSPPRLLYLCFPNIKDAKGEESSFSLAKASTFSS